jgi:hypothetical protein
LPRPAARAALAARLVAAHPGTRWSPGRLIVGVAVTRGARGARKPPQPGVARSGTALA